MSRSVAIVLDPDYSGELEKLAFRTPVWIVDTPPNRAAAEDAWRSAVEWPHITVTLFRPPESEATRDDWRALLGQVSLLERNVDGYDVFGAALTLSARAALTEAGFVRFEETENGFRARRA
jgi:hypothetical protein